MMISLVGATTVAAAAAAAATGPSACVVGAGIGGLYTAAKLAREGLQVTLIEKNSREHAGGRLACESIVAANGRSYRFETGPSLLLLPGVYRDALSSLGVDASRALQLRQCNPSYGVHFDDGLPSPLEIGGDAAAERKLESDMEKVEPGSYAAYTDYLTAARAMLDAGLPIAICEQFGAAEAAKVPRFLQAALLGGGSLSDSGRVTPLRDWPLRSHGAQLREVFEVERHRQLASFQDLYIGLPPDEAPAVFSLLQAIELAPPGADGGDSGVFYPLGGWGTVRDAFLEAVESAGVKCLWDTTVEGVEFKDGEVSGVRVAPTPAAPSSSMVQADPCPAIFSGSDGAPVQPTSLMADRVVIDADLAAAEALLPPEYRRSDYAEISEQGGGEGWRYSSSTVSFYFCLDVRYPQLRHHNVFIGGNGAWDGLFDAAAYSEWPQREGTLNFYVHAPARTDPSVVETATDDAIMVLVPVPPIDERLGADERRETTEKAVERARAAVLLAFAKAGMDGFEDAIVEERVRTPLGWRDAYGLRRGSVFGLSHPLSQLSIFRPGRRSTGDANGVHWVGASTRPGNGVPLVLIGAQKTANEVLAGL